VENNFISITVWGFKGKNDNTVYRQKLLVKKYLIQRTKYPVDFQLGYSSITKSPNLKYQI